MKDSDRDVVLKLGSRDPKESFDAAKEILRRGERVIPALLENKADSRPYAWGSLGQRNSGEITFAPSGNPEWDEGRIITVEVASIYLICAIYHGSLEFAASAYLKDDADVEFNKYNTVARVAKAWASVESWLDALRTQGLAELRARSADPLGSSGLYF